MKKSIWGKIFLVMAVSVLLTACGSGEGVKEEGSSGAADGQELKIAFLVDKLGDNSANDESYRGVKQFEEETGIKVLAVEAPEFQDREMNARTFAQEGYDLILDSSSRTSELYASIADEFPDTHFVILEGTVSDKNNVTSLRCRPSESAFLAGVFSAYMNQELNGESETAFVGGVRNPNLERSQYGFTAGTEYANGTSTSVYIGNFTDVAKGKEIALQLYNKGIKLVQAFAGGGSMGVYQAAESMGSGYYALGEGAGQFDLSDSILASQVKYSGTFFYDAVTSFYRGDLQSGIISAGLKEGVVGIRYNPIHEDIIPQEIKDTIQKLQDQIISGELVPPSTEEEYKAFNK